MLAGAGSASVSGTETPWPGPQAAPLRQGASPAPVTDQRSTLNVSPTRSEKARENCRDNLTARPPKGAVSEDHTVALGLYSCVKEPLHDLMPRDEVSRSTALHRMPKDSPGG